MTIGEKLKAERLKNNMTQEELSKKLYVSRQTISRWEQNRTLPNIEVLKELSSIYKIPLNNLITEEEVKSMKKVNIFALIGSIIFNFYMICTVGVLLVLVLGLAWLMTGLAISMPIILLISAVLGWQVVVLKQIIFSIICFAVGILAFFILKKLTTLIITFAKKYIKFNLKTIFIETV